MKPQAFRWNEWNLEHATGHGASIEEIESIVLNAQRPYPMRSDRGTFSVIGRGVGGRLVKVVYVVDPDGRTAFVIHSMPLSSAQKRRYRRGRR
jgi:hypothetical protein